MPTQLHSRSVECGPVARKRRDYGAFPAFLRAHRAVTQRLEREIEVETGLPLSWYEVLLVLNSAPDRRLRINELADGVILSRSRVSRLVDEMTRAALVERQTDPADGRGCFAAMTPEGRARFRRAAPVHLRGIEEHFGRHLTSTEHETMKRALERVAAAAADEGVVTR
jgi:DNA-binding MarR family transcriptional regulator